MAMHKVELYIEVPDTVAPPKNWDWEAIVNFENDPKMQCPIGHVICTPVPSGTA